MGLFGRGVAVALGVGDGCSLNGLWCLVGVPLGLGDAVPGGTVALGGGDPPIGAEIGLLLLGGAVAVGVAVGLDGIVVLGGAIPPDPDIGAEIGLLLSGGAVAIGAAVATGNAVAPGGTVALGGGVCPG